MPNIDGSISSSRLFLVGVLVIFLLIQFFPLSSISCCAWWRLHEYLKHSLEDVNFLKILFYVPLMACFAEARILVYSLLRRNLQNCLTVDVKIYSSSNSPDADGTANLLPDQKFWEDFSVRLEFLSVSYHHLLGTGQPQHFLPRKNTLTIGKNIADYFSAVLDTLSPRPACSIGTAEMQHLLLLNCSCVGMKI